MRRASLVLVLALVLAGARGTSPVSAAALHAYSAHGTQLYTSVTATKHCLTAHKLFVNPGAPYWPAGQTPAPTAHFIFADRSGLIRFWNRGAERTFGYSPQEAVGSSLDIIIPERLRGRHWEAYAETMRTGKTRYGEGDVLAVPAIRKDSTRISIEFTIFPYRDRQGNLIGVVATLRDVTKRFEEIKALRKALASQPGAKPVS